MKTEISLIILSLAFFTACTDSQFKSLEEQSQNNNELKRAVNGHLGLDAVKSSIASGAATQNTNLCINGQTLVDNQIGNNLFEFFNIDNEKGQHEYVKHDFTSSTAKLTTCKLELNASTLQKINDVIKETNSCYAIPVIDQNGSETGEVYSEGGYISSDKNSKVLSLLSGATKSSCKAEEFDLTQFVEEILPSDSDSSSNNDYPDWRDDHGAIAPAPPEGF